MTDTYVYDILMFLIEIIFCPKTKDMLHLTPPHIKKQCAAIKSNNPFVSICRVIKM